MSKNQKMITWVEEHMSVQDCKNSEAKAREEAQSLMYQAEGSNRPEAWTAYRKKQDEVQFWQVMQRKLSSV